MKSITQTKLILLSVLFLAFFDNYAFFKNTLVIYPFDTNTAFVISLFLVLVAFNTILFTLVSSKYTTKPVLITVILISSLTNYFMNTYSVVIDDSMIRNIFQTNLNESEDLFSIWQVVYFIFLGVLPSVLIYKVDVEYAVFKKELMRKLKYISVSLFVIVVSVLFFSKYYTSFVREHKPLRFSVNPTYWIYSIGKYMASNINTAPKHIKIIGSDAQVVENKEDDNLTELIIMVVGEAARADHFSLNGYSRQTNPMLSSEDIVNFSNMYSCGTSTAESVPCMFSIFDKADYSYKKGRYTQNILDVLSSTGYIDILWRDNNSDSKGVALRVAYENYKTKDKNSVCTDGECRDEGMLVGLDEYIEKHKGKDILIVLHQMGNHGPAYYKRYPKSFEKFIPVCKTNQLEKCTQEEISNAYDNAILYTDYFLEKTIQFLKKYDKDYETALVYMSDHGESLGENGIYLHGMPYFMAPEAQIHIGSFMWLGKELKKELNMRKMQNIKTEKFSQDNLFHTLLGIFEVDTSVYKKEMDILNAAK